MMMLVAKTGLIGSSLGVVTLAQVAPLLDQGARLGGYGALGIMGVCLCACVYAVVVLYKDKEADRLKIENLLERCAKAMESVTESAKANATLLVEVKDALIKCKNNARP
jgi:hypothetical protein